MAGSFYNNSNDSIDISELASLNEDISDDLLDELQGKLSQNINSFNDESQNKENDDTALFEEPAEQSQDGITKSDENLSSEPENNANAAEKEEVSSDNTEETLSTDKKDEVKLNQNYDDNFIKKYKAKLNKKAQIALSGGTAVDGSDTKSYMQEQEGEPIEALSNGNITEHVLTQELKDYNESLDFLDGNVKYSKYVIYIDPQNVDFIEGLTVKERKNLINNILRQQDDIGITKQRFAFIQTVIRHVIVAILTLSISIPLVYYVINASLEATIDNHRRSQTNWQTLYREHGKITQN